MYVLRTIASHGWAPALITALVIVGYFYQWPVAALGPLLAVILVISLVIAVVKAKERQLELAALRLRQLSTYFDRRFMGSSSLSIFVIIDIFISIISYFFIMFFSCFRTCYYHR